MHEVIAYLSKRMQQLTGPEIRTLLPFLSLVIKASNTYAPLSAVLGSVIVALLLSRFVTRVEPGLWDQRPLLSKRYQWKSRLWVALPREHRGT